MTILILLCGICYLKIPEQKPFWTVVLRALKEKEMRNKTLKYKSKKVFEDIRLVNYNLKLGDDGDGSKLVCALYKTRFVFP